MARKKKLKAKDIALLFVKHRILMMCYNYDFDDAELVFDESSIEFDKSKIDWMLFYSDESYIPPCSINAKSNGNKWRINID
jgi:hypothetical protein